MCKWYGTVLSSHTGQPSLPVATPAIFSYRTTRSALPFSQCKYMSPIPQAWLERNQEKFGARQVKFGYVVYSEAETAERLFRQGSIAVRRGSGHHCQVGRGGWARLLFSCPLGKILTGPG